MTRARRVLGALTLVGPLATIACGPPVPADVVADSRTLSIQVLTDGSARVRDALTLRSAGGGFTLERRVTNDRVDAFEAVTAFTDARPGREEASGVQIEAAARPIVRWSLPPDRLAGPHDYVVDYRAVGVVGLSGNRGRLEWQVSPASPPLRVGLTQVRLTLPPGVAVFELPSIDFAGCMPVADAVAFVLECRDMPPDDAAVLTTEFSVDGFPMLEPRWQRSADRAGELMPAWVSSGIFVLVSAWGVLIMLRISYPPIGADDPTPAPADVSRPHVDALGRRAWSPALAQALIEAGLVDKDRLAAARALHVSGVAVAILGAACTGLVPLVLSTFGRWPYVLPASIVIVGIWLAVAGRRFRTLTPAGEAVRRAAEA